MPRSCKVGLICTSYTQGGPNEMRQQKRSGIRNAERGQCELGSVSKYASMREEGRLLQKNSDWRRHSIVLALHKSYSLVVVACILALSPLTPDTASASAGKNDTVIKGVVRDSESGEPIPFATISIVNTDRGTVTNEAGEFKIYLHPSDSLIKVSAIGFNSRKQQIQSRPGTIVDVNIDLAPSTIQLQAIEVFADGLTPAERIISRAIERKKEILAAIDNYSFKAYTKTIVSYQTKHDSAFNVAFITETASDGYWRRPDKYKEIIVARKQGATLLPEWNTIGVDRIPNFNRNSLKWDGEKVPTPTAENALDIYRFWITDTLYIDSVAIFYLGFEPKKDSSLLRGIIGIANKTYEVREVNVSRLTDVQGSPEKTEVTYSQRFRKFSGDHWMPVDLHVDGQYPDDSTTWKFEQFIVIQDYAIDVDLPGGIFDRFTLEVAQGADDVDSTEWARRQAIPLSERDSVGYEHTDFLKDSVLASNKAIRIGFGIYQFNRGLNRFIDHYHLSSIADWYHYNSVEGNYFGVGFKKSVYQTGLIGKVAGGYAVSSSRWNYYLSAGWRFDKYHETTVSFSLFDNVAPIAYQPGVTPPGATFQTLAVQRDPENYNVNKGWSAKVAYRPLAKWQAEVTYDDVTQRSVATGTDFTLRGSHVFRENPAADYGELRQFGAYLRYDSRDYQRSGADVSLAFNRNATLFVLAHERAGDEIVGGDFFYKKYYTELAMRRRSRLGRTSLSVQYGYANGAPSAQALFRLAPRRGLTNFPNRLKTIGSSEFFGDRYGFIGASHVFRIDPFRYIPLPVIHGFSGQLALHGAVGWTDFNARRAQFSLTAFPDASGVYYEAGFGIADLLPVGTLWFSWRLSSFDTDKFSATFGF